MENTMQGTFTSATTAAKILKIRSDLDWMHVYNYTKLAANTASTGLQFYWQRVMPAGSGLEYKNNAARDATHLKLITSGGFTLIDSSVMTLSARMPVGGAMTITGATPPVVTTVHDLSVGEIVRLTNVTGAPQICGTDFTVTAVTGATNFTIGNISLDTSAAGTAGYWTRIPYQPLYYPSNRYITFVAASATAGRAKVYMSVTHGFTVGQKVRLKFPGAVWGTYTELDGTACTVVAINEARAGAEPNNGGVANNIVVDVDVSGYGNWNVFGGAALCYPKADELPFSQAQVVPIGQNTATSLAAGVDILEDSTINTGYIGIKLGSGADGPAGVANDVIYWVAGKSFNV